MDFFNLLGILSEDELLQSLNLLAFTFLDVPLLVGKCTIPGGTICQSLLFLLEILNEVMEHSKLHLLILASLFLHSQDDLLHFRLSILSS